MQELPPGFELDAAPARPTETPGIIQGLPAQIKPIDERRLNNEEKRIEIAEQGQDRQDRIEGRGAVGEQQSFVLATRIGGGIDDLNFIMEQAPSSNRSPGLGESILYDVFGPNSVATRGLTDEARVAIEDTQMDILDALLTLGTGAAYNAEQLQGQRAAYFPQFNDKPWQIDLKRRKLARLFDAVKRRAGPLSVDLDKYQNSLLGAAAPKKATPRDKMPLGVRLNIDSGDDEFFDRSEYLQKEFGIDPGQETRLVGMINANIGNPNLTEDMLANIYATAGVSTPSPEDMQTMLAEMREGRAPATGIDTATVRAEYEEMLNRREQQRTGARIDEQVGVGNAAVAGAGQGQTLGFVDEAAGVGEAVVGILAGQDPIANYQIERDRMRLWNQQNAEASPVTHTAALIAGSIAAGGAGAAGRVKSVGDAAKVGAVEGAVAGFGSGDGLADSTKNAFVGAGLGAGTGAALQSTGNKIASTLAARRQSRLVDNATEVADAGERMGVTTRRADVDPSAREARGRVQQADEGRQALKNASEADLAELEAVLIKNLGGGSTGRTQGGQSIQGGVKARIQSLRDTAKPLYRQAQAQAGGARHTPEASLAKINEHIAALAEGGRQGNAAKIKYLEDLRSDITQDGGLSIDGLRMRRTNLSKDLDSAGVYTSDFERRVGEVLDGVSDDIGKSLELFPDAAAKYAEADGLWRQQAKLRKNIGDQLLGRNEDLGAGQAAARVMAWAKNDPRRLMRLMDEVAPDTQAEVRALIAGQLGRQSNGQFQLGAFLRETGEGSGGRLSPAALRAVFGEDGVKAIRDLRILAQAKTDAADATNYSNTGSSIRKAAGSFRRMMLGMFGFSAVDGTGAAALAGGGAMLGGELVEKLGNQRTIRMLLDPDFTKALRTAPNTNKPQAIDRWFSSLRRSATRNPSLLVDVEALERAIFGIANDNSARIAAEPANADQPRQMENQRRN